MKEEQRYQLPEERSPSLTFVLICLCLCGILGVVVVFMWWNEDKAPPPEPARVITQAESNQAFGMAIYALTNRIPDISRIKLNTVHANNWTTNGEDWAVFMLVDGTNESGLYRVPVVIEMTRAGGVWTLTGLSEGERE